MGTSSGAYELKHECATDVFYFFTDTHTYTDDIDLVDCQWERITNQTLFISLSLDLYKQKNDTTAANRVNEPNPYIYLKM